MTGLHGKQIFMHWAQRRGQGKLSGGAKEGGGLGAKPPGKFLGPRPLLWRRTHLPISCSPLVIRKLS